MSTTPAAPSIAQQMFEDGSLPDKPDSGTGMPMRAVVAAAATMDPDKEAGTQQLAQQSAMGVDLVRHDPAAAQRRAVNADLDRRDLEITNPILAHQLQNPNFAGVAHDDLDSLSGIEQGAATVRAYTPTWRDKVTDAAQTAFETVGGTGSLKQKLFEEPLARLGIGALEGTEDVGGNVGAFLGWHGDRGGLNPLQRSAQTLTPQAFGSTPAELDKLAQTAGPLLPSLGAGAAAGVLARTLGLSENAAKVLAAAGVGSLFSADQGGSTFSQMKAAGKSDAEARHAADVVAGINLAPNVGMGLTDFAPFLKRNPLLAALGIGGLTGTTGQYSQNLVTGQPWYKNIGAGAAEGAAVQGGMHMGFSAFEGEGSEPGEGSGSQGSPFHRAMSDIADATEQSKLRTRSPEAFQSFLGQQFEGDPSVRIPAQDFVNYFHGKNIDPAAMANRLGVSNLEEAATAGTDLEIPKADFFGSLEPEHVKGLLPDIIDPATELTARQAEAGHQELNDWIAGGGAEKLQAEYAQADAETQATPEWQSVQRELKQRYADAGETDEAADSYATLHANAIANLAKNAGLKPDELLALHNPAVTVGEAPEGGATPVRYQEAIEKIRSVVDAANQEGDVKKREVIAPVDPWLAEAAKQHGLDIEGSSHSVDADAIRHAKKNHSGQESEAARGQLALTDEDFEHIPSIVAEPDRVVFGSKTKKGLDAIGYVKRLPDGHIAYIEEVRQRKGQLAAVSMWKYPATADVDRIAANVHPNARSDGGALIVVPGPGADKGEPGEDTDDVLHQAARSEGFEARKARNLASARAQGDLLRGASGPDTERHLIHNKWSEVGTEFTSTMGQEELKPGDIVGENEQGRALKVLSLGDKTATGGQWYNFKVVNADEARAAGETVIPNIKKPRVNLDEPEGTLEQNQPRGWFRVRPDGSYEIGKTSIGDFSTFVHEPAHAYLELFRELTQRAGASDPLKDDFKKIAEWLGTTPEEAYKNGFTREQHEQWARANEQYVREGNAPTSGLRRAFQNFAVWLGSIYRKASSLGVELNGDIRGVMDRLYAGEEAVNRAGQESGEQLFSSPEEAGWSESEYRNYADAKGVALDKAREQVRAEMNDAALRDRTQAWREEKANVRDAITQQIDARPEYTAIRTLRRGSLEDGTPLTLSREALVNQFGEDRVKALQDAHRGLYRNEGGTDADTAAELFGYDSGDEMLRALQSAPRRGLAIEQAARDYMTAKHGDIRYDGSLDDKARLAVENDDRAKGLRRELTALRTKVADLQKKAADSKAAMASIAVAPLEQYQEAARGMIDQKAIADLQPYRYLNASRKFSREAFDAVRKGDVQKAADAKNKELLNHFLFREASAARDYADKFESYAKRMQSRGIQQRLGLAGGDYREQFNWLLARYKLGAPMAAPERPLRAWADEAFDKGNEVAIAPGILNEGRFADYRSIPLSEVRDLHDALLNVRHLAMREFKTYVQGKQVEFATAKNAMIDSARENLRVRPEMTFEENRSMVDRAMEPLRYVDARLIRMERLIEWLDGGKTGPWHDNLWNLASDAQGEEYRLQEGTTRLVTDALADMPAEMRRRLWTEKVNVDGVTEPLTRRGMLSMAFNMGNEGNLDRLKKTFIDKGWDPEAIRRIGGMLTREEWQFVQKTWGSLKPLGKQADEMEKRLTGVPLAMVKVTPFKVALDGGDELYLEGGYFPIVMDPKHSQRAIEQDSKTSAQNAMQSGYVRATTSKGYTKERTGYGGQLLLDYEQALTSHVAKVSKDLSHREFMLSSQRLLLDTEVRKTLRETLGLKYEEQFMPWLRTIINDNNGGVGERLDGLKEGMQKLRGNIVVASLGFNASTSLLQISHAPRMLLYARPTSLAQSFLDLVHRPMEATQEIRDLSPNEMKFRGDNLDRDIRAVLQNPEYKGEYARKVAVAGRFALQVMDHLLSHTLWRAAYNDALGKYVEMPEDQAQEKAAHEADSAVRLGLGTSAPKDLPAIMRSNEFNKFITTLYGFHNGVYNQLRDNAHQFRYDRTMAGAGKLTYAGILTALLPAVLGSWLTGQRPKDDENAGWWAAKRALAFSADTIPLLRAVASGVDRGQHVQFSPIEAVMDKGAKAGMETVASKDDKDWLGIGLDASEFAGTMLGVPGTHQAVKTLRYIKRANEGRIDDPNPWNAIVGGGR